MNPNQLTKNRNYPLYLTTMQGQVVTVTGPATVDGERFTFPNQIEGYTFTCNRSELSRSFANKRAAQRWVRNLRKNGVIRAALQGA